MTNGIKNMASALKDRDIFVLVLNDDKKSFVLKPNRWNEKTGFRGDDFLQPYGWIEVSEYEELLNMLYEKGEILVSYDVSEK